MIDPTLLKAFITMMAAVIGLSVLLFILKRKSLSRSMSSTQTVQSLSVDARLSVTPKSQVIVVHYGDRKFMLGITEHSINLIADLSIPAVPSTESSAVSAPLSHGTVEQIHEDDLSFAAFIKSITKRENSKN